MESRKRSRALDHYANDIPLSPKTIARIEGALYLVIIFAGMFVQLFVRGKIYVVGDANATAARLREFEMLWRAGVATELFTLLITICSTLLLYVLLRPVSRDLALLATFFGLIGIATETTYALQLLEALFPLGKASYLAAFTPAQLHAMTMLRMRAHANGFAISLLVFGTAFLLRGHLIARSGYFPKTVGVLYQIAGAAYMLNSFLIVLAPQRASMLIMLPAFIGEMTFCLWLLIRGVDIKGWNARVDASRAMQLASM
ncbi:MAG: DUF4386 domain-containing protein [Acidobacteriota bacterium]|nr:DUF4386 domain-containing protein [Acidobacteriota bacterium]